MYRSYRKMTIKWSFFYIIYTFLGSIFEPCYIQNRVITNHVIKRLCCVWVSVSHFQIHCIEYIDEQRHPQCEEICYWTSIPAKTPISLLIWAVWSVFAVCVKKPWFLSIRWVLSMTDRTAWMCRAHSDAHLSGYQEVAGLIPAESIMKYFLWSFSPFC